MLRPYKQSERDHIERMVRAAELALKPDLECLFYGLEDDHSGEPAIFFRMVISDRLAHASRKQGDFSRVREMEAAIRAIVEPEEYGLFGYFDVRSLEECRELKDRRWPVPEEKVENVG